MTAPNNNPDFSLAAKRLIAKAVQKVLSTPINGTTRRAPQSAARVTPAGLPPAMYQGQVMQVTSQHQWGADWPMAHSMTP